MIIEFWLRIEGVKETLFDSLAHFNFYRERRRSMEAITTNVTSLQAQVTAIEGGNASGEAQERGMECPSALLALDVKLREMVEAVYRDNDEIISRVRKLERENERLRREVEHRQETFAAAAEERGAEVSRLQQELFASKQANQQLTRRQVECVG